MVGLAADVELEGEADVVVGLLDTVLLPVSPVLLVTLTQ